MKRVLFVLLLLGLASPGAAQDGSLYLSSQRQPIRISFDALYQTYAEDGGDLNEFSLPVAVSVPIGQRFGVSLLASQASADGDAVESLSGVSDVQVGMSYYQPIGNNSLVASLGVNLPSGPRELTEEEFATSITFSQHYYDFRVPGFGQGFNVAPGFVFAFPAGGSVVLGLGASYQVKGPYKPIEGMDEDYDPGDELILTGGLDYRLDEAGNLSLDVTFTRYASDTVGDEEVFTPGTKVTATAQLLRRFGFHEFRLVGRYRSLSKSTLPGGTGQADEELRTLPSQTLVRASFRPRLGEIFWLGLVAQGRFFDATDVFESRTLFDVGAVPEVAFSSRARLRARFLYTLGDFTGFEAGGGLVFML